MALRFVRPTDLAAAVPEADAEPETGFRLWDYTAAVFDLDGTLWLNGDPLPGAVDFVNGCRAAGLRIGFATNINLQTPEEVAAKLGAVGLARPGDHVVTASYSIAETIVAAGVRRVAFVGGPTMRERIEGRGIEVVPAASVERDEWREPAPGLAAVMAGWPDVTLREIETIGQLGAWGIPVFVSSLDPGFPGKDRFEPGVGMMVAAARYLHRFEPTICGKPSAGYAAAVRAGFVTDARIVMFGDNQRADIGTAHLMDADGVLIFGDLYDTVDPAGPQPEFVVDAIGDLPRRWSPA